MTAPLVLLGALGTDARLWDGVLTGGVRVEHPGHGGAPLDDARTVHALAARVLRVLDAQNIGACHLAGVSLGAAVALVLAAHHPQRVRTLTLAHTAPQFGAPALWNQRIATARGDGMAPLAAGTLARWLTPEEIAADPARAERLTAMFLATHAEGYARCCEAVRDFDGRPPLALVRAPTLVVAGQQDAATPPAAARELQQGIAGARLLELPGAHLGLLSAPQRFAAALHHHIQRGDPLCPTT